MLYIEVIIFGEGFTILPLIQREMADRFHHPLRRSEPYARDGPNHGSLGPRTPEAPSRIALQGAPGLVGPIFNPADLLI